MRTISHIITFILTVAILAAGFPRFNPEDVNRDTRIDLQDVILSAKDFAKAAEETSSFAEKVRQVISALYVAAGLKTVIKADSPESASNYFDHPYLISLYDFSFELNRFSDVSEKLLVYTSINISPDTPPPRDRFVSFG